MLTILLIIFGILILKWVYHTFLTNSSEKRNDEYKNSGPVDEVIPLAHSSGSNGQYRNTDPLVKGEIEIPKTGMKKSIRTIIIHLCTQGLIGWLLDAMLEDTVSFVIGHEGALICEAILAILIAHLILSFIIDQPQEVIRRGLYWGFLFWFFIVPMFIVFFSSGVGGFKKYKLKKLIQENSLKAAKQIGLTNLVWDSEEYRYRISPKKGMMHFFTADDRKIYIYPTIKIQPDYYDTLAWLRTALKESQPYITSTAFQVLDSSILRKNYRFKKWDNFVIFSKEKQFTDIWIEVTSSSEIKGAYLSSRLYITIPINKLTIGTSENTKN